MRVLVARGAAVRAVARAGCAPPDCPLLDAVALGAGGGAVAVVAAAGAGAAVAATGAAGVGASAAGGGAAGAGGGAADAATGTGAADAATGTGAAGATVAVAGASAAGGGAAGAAPGAADAATGTGAAGASSRAPPVLDLGLVRRCHRDVHRLALEGRRPLDHAMVLDRLAEPDEQVATDLGMGELATAELDGDLDAVSVLQELDRTPDLRIEVADADLRLEADFLEGDRALLSLGFLLALGELVLVLPEVEEPDDRRRRHRRDLDEVEPPLLRKSKGLLRGHHAPLVPLFVDDPDLWDTDHLIYAQVSADVSALVAGSYGSVGARNPRDRAVAGERLARPFRAGNDAAGARPEPQPVAGTRSGGLRAAGASRAAAPRRPGRDDDVVDHDHIVILRLTTRTWAGRGRFTPFAPVSAVPS